MVGIKWSPDWTPLTLARRNLVYLWALAFVDNSVRQTFRVTIRRHLQNLLFDVCVIYPFNLSRCHDHEVTYAYDHSLNFSIFDYKCRPASSHGVTVCHTISALFARSPGKKSKSHGGRQEALKPLKNPDFQLFFGGCKQMMSIKRCENTPGHYLQAQQPFCFVFFPWGEEGQWGQTGLKVELKVPHPPKPRPLILIHILFSSWQVCKCIHPASTYMTLILVPVIISWGMYHWQRTGSRTENDNYNPHPRSAGNFKWLSVPLLFLLCFLVGRGTESRGGSWAATSNKLWEG